MRYPYRDGLATLSEWSDRRPRTSSAISSWIAESADAPVSLLDVGTGDGELLALSLSAVLDRINLTNVELVEPDADLRTTAVDRLTALRIPSSAITVVNSLDEASRDFSHAMLAHVMYYLLPAERSLAQVHERLNDDGSICIVVRSERCDTYRLRQIVRAHEGTHPRISAASLSDALRLAGFARPSMRTAAANLRTPDGVRVLPTGAETITTDPAFDYVIRWMTRLPESGPIEADLRESLRSFIEDRIDTPAIQLNLEDLVITARAPAAATD